MQPFEHGGNIHLIKRHNRAATIVDFSANINPLGLNANIEQTILQNIREIIHYPDPQAHELRQALITHYKVSNKQLTLGNGAAELIYLYARVSGKSQALLLAPCFSEYQRACHSANLPVQILYLHEQDNFAIDYAQLSAQLPDNAIVFLANPNNPTGTLLDKNQVVKLLQLAADKNTDIFIDESFADFVEQEFSCASLMHRFDNLAILHSLTKIFAIPGLRLGFGLFNARIATLIEQAKDVWNVNSLAQLAGVTALQQTEYLLQTRIQVSKLRQDLYTELLTFPQLKVYPSSVNFLLIKLQNGMTAPAFREKMLEQGILTRDCSNYPGLDNTFIRIAVRTALENKFFIQSLQVILRS